MPLLSSCALAWPAQARAFCRRPGAGRAVGPVRAVLPEREELDGLAPAQPVHRPYRRVGRLEANPDHLGVDCQTDEPAAVLLDRRVGTAVGPDEPGAAAHRGSPRSKAALRGLIFCFIS